MKTLQQQYLLIKEGKGNKEQFLKHARYLFPEFITVNNDYNTTTGILKGKGILTEAIGGIATLNPNKPDWFKIFDNNLREAVGVKDKEEYGDQNTFKASKETEETLKKANFDNADPKNIDNVYGQSFLVGYYTEMKDPKNADKTVDELKDIVLKNMSKDVTYYNTEAFMGTKGIGFKTDVVGGGEPVEPKGKYKSSGYGDMPKTVKEGLNEGIGMFNDPIGYEKGAKSKIEIARDILTNAGLSEEEIKKFISDNMFKKGKLSDLAQEYVNSLKEGLNEAKKRPGVAAEIKEIEKSNEALALESKIEKIKEAIAMRENKLKIAESEEVVDMIDEKMVKTLQKEIKELEKYKAKAEGLYEKLTKTKSKEVIDEFDMHQFSSSSQPKASFEDKWNSVPAANKEILKKSTGKEPIEIMASSKGVNYVITKGSDGKFYRYEYKQAENPGAPSVSFDTIEKAKEGIK